MRHRRRTAILTAWVVAVAVARVATAGCGDGQLQAGEQCDPLSPNSQTACPGACITPPNQQACQCAFVSTDPAAFAAIADVQASLAGSATVTKGSVAVVQPMGLLSVAPGAVIDGSSQAIGDRCRLMPTSSVGRLFCNTPAVAPGATVLDGGPFAFAAPLAFPSLPPFTTGSGGGIDVVVAAGSTRYLAPGIYGNLIVEDGGKLILQGLDAGSGSGRYDVLGVKVINSGTVLAENPVVLNVKNVFRLLGTATFRSSPITSVQPGDIHVNVEGRGAKLGKGAFVQAHVRAPNGKITIGRSSIVMGQLIAQKITISKNGVLRETGGCGDGVKEPTEICDPTAAGGDPSCPGTCIPPGSPGQCTCPCASDADCDDQNACNGVETCSQGHCVFGTPPSCDDGNPCTKDCDPAIGCVDVPLTDGTACDDGNQCTKNDTCIGGVCTPGAPRTCDDANDCTTDSCDPVKGCRHDPITGQSCSDGNACTQGDACIRGNCIGGTTVGCDDANACTTDSCDPTLGCQHAVVADGLSCAGTSPCTALDTCQGGVCVGHGAQLCSDGNECTTDACSLVGPAGAQTVQCDSTPVANFTPCGPGGTKNCFNGVCL